ncbi:MAG: metal-dependent hydrolase, partial [Anaerolineales bacterium]
MPSPIAHVTAGYVLYKLSRHRWPALDTRRLGPFPRLLVITAGLSMLPDIDSVLGFLTGDFGRFHNNVTHSLIVGFAVALAIAAVMQWR